MADRRYALLGHTHSSGGAEVNDLTSAVTWANVPDANITETSVTQHEAALTITESQISDLSAYLLTVTASDIDAEASTDGYVLTSDGAGNAAWEILPTSGGEVNDLTAAVTWANIPDANVPQSAVTQHEAALSITESQISDLGTYLTDITGEVLGDLSDATITSATTGDFVRRTGGAWVNTPLVEADLPNHDAGLLQSGSVPTARISEAAVTQHQAALTITESQISDLGAYITGISGETLGDLGDATVTSPVSGQYITRQGGAWVNSAILEDDLPAHSAGLLTSGTLSNARVTESNVTQHEAALSITESQISDLGAYITGISGENVENLANVAVSGPATGQYLRRQSGQWQNAVIPAADLPTHDAGLITTGSFADARVAESNVTQHEAALDITTSQVVSGTFADARISESSVTQHEAALSITESQISDLAHTDATRSELNTQNGNYTLVIGDAGKTLYKASGGAGETLTIPANASVAFAVGTLIAFQNDGGGDLTIAITSDTLEGTDGTTGSRTLGDHETAVIQKLTTTKWRYTASDI